MSFLLQIAASLVLSTQVITVCTNGCMYSSVHAGVAAAHEGDVVEVRGGHYREASSIIVDKTIVLQGIETPEITGNGTGSILVINAPRVTVKGFIIANSGMSYTQEIAGIRVEDTTEASISENIFRNNAYGIYLANAERCTIEGNSFAGSGASDSESGNGIHSWKGKQHTIRHNTVANHRDGIYLEFTDDSQIQGNIVHGNKRYGLHFMSSHRNEYLRNRFEENGAGVAVMYSRNVRMIENVFSNNRGVASYGLLLKDINAGEVRANIFDDNTFGIYMEDTNRTKFFDNTFVRNGYGLRVLGNCDDNVFTHNNFDGNTFDVATNSSRNPNTFSENYWNAYKGYDLDSDGKGDVPYRPVSLSSVITEKVDATYSLIRSPLFIILDEIEQSFPMLIPETLKDEKPLMHAWVVPPVEIR